MADAAILFERHHLPVFRYLRRMTGDPDQAEELTQEVFLRVVRAVGKYREHGRERAWVFRIARNVLLNRHRDASRAAAAGPLDHDPPSGRDDRIDDAIGLQRSLAGLPEPQREAFLLRELGGLGYQEIAAVCGGTTDSVRSRIYRARRALQDALAPSPRERGRPETRR